MWEVMDLRQEAYTMIGNEEKKITVSNRDDLTFANDWNTLSARFDTSELN